MKISAKFFCENLKKILNLSSKEEKVLLEYRDGKLYIVCTPPEYNIYMSIPVTETENDEEFSVMFPLDSCLEISKSFEKREYFTLEEVKDEKGLRHFNLLSDNKKIDMRLVEKIIDVEAYDRFNYKEEKVIKIPDVVKNFPKTNRFSIDGTKLNNCLQRIGHVQGSQHLLTFYGFHMFIRDKKFIFFSSDSFCMTHLVENFEETGIKADLLLPNHAFKMISLTKGYSSEITFNKKRFGMKISKEDGIIILAETQVVDEESMLDYDNQITPFLNGFEYIGKIEKKSANEIMQRMSFFYQDNNNKYRDNRITLILENDTVQVIGRNDYGIKESSNTKGVLLEQSYTEDVNGMYLKSYFANSKSDTIEVHKKGNLLIFTEEGFLEVMPTYEKRE